jgi:NAD(P)-dependent dehydrogenase (short-subunit alcohol dehydrogenase family)
MAEIEIVRIPATAESADALIEVLRQARSDYLSPPACLAVDIARGEGEVVAIIRWASIEAHRLAASTPAAGALFGVVQKLAAAAPSAEKLRVSGGRLAGKVALVTGGASGIGRAVVDRFVAEGARVGVVDVNVNGLSSLAEQHGDAIVTIKADLSRGVGNIDAVDRTVAAFGRLDTFVANAGLFDGFLEFAGAASEQLEQGFDTIFGINVRGLILGCHAALPHLVRSRGSIIVTLSNAALYPDGGGIMYVASKHAALGVVRQLAHELAPAVRVNAVAPGATRTSIGVPDIFGGPVDQTTPEISSAISSLAPLGLHAEASDHAAAYVLLAADTESRAMTGTVIESDGGLGVRGLRRTRGGDGLAAQFPGE